MLAKRRWLATPRARLIAASGTCANSSAVYSLYATAAVEAGTCRYASRTRSLISLLCIKSWLMGRAPPESRLSGGGLHPGPRHGPSWQGNAAAPEQTRALRSRLGIGPDAPRLRPGSPDLRWRRGTPRGAGWLPGR